MTQVRGQGGSRRGQTTLSAQEDRLEQMDDRTGRVERRLTDRMDRVEKRLSNRMEEGFRELKSLIKGAQAG